MSAAKVKWAGHTVKKKRKKKKRKRETGNRRTIRSIELQVTKQGDSAGRLRRCLNDGIVRKQETTETTWKKTAKDRESRRTLAEGYFLQWKDTA